MGSTRDPRQTTEWLQIKPEIRKRDQYRCQGCGMAESVWAGVDLQVHHIRPVESGGGNAPENLVTLCNRCHWKLHRREATGERLPPSLLKDQTSYTLPATRRENAQLTDIKAEIIELLKANGPMQLKDIIDRTGRSRGNIQKQLDLLGIAGYVGRVSRGVYSYITENEYWKAQQESEERAESNNSGPVLMDSHEPKGKVTYWCYQSKKDRLENPRDD